MKLLTTFIYAEELSANQNSRIHILAEFKKLPVVHVSCCEEDVMARAAPGAGAGVGMTITLWPTTLHNPAKCAASTGLRFYRLCSTQLIFHSCIAHNRVPGTAWPGHNHTQYSYQAIGRGRGEPRTGRRDLCHISYESLPCLEQNIFIADYHHLSAKFVNIFVWKLLGGFVSSDSLRLKFNEKHIFNQGLLLCVERREKYDPV